jgi:hypothetical protein
MNVPILGICYGLQVGSMPVSLYDSNGFRVFFSYCRLFLTLIRPFHGILGNGLAVGWEGCCL